MTLTVNLLPWRRSDRQRRQCCRIGIMVSVIALLVSSFWGGWVLRHQSLMTLQEQGSELEHQHHKLQEKFQQQKIQPQGEQQYRSPEVEKERQHRVSRWGYILTKLASKFPENSWLQSIGWQSNILTLEGYTSEIGDLEKIEVVLKQLPGAFHIKAGPVSYQAAQELTYTFFLEEMGGAFVSP